MKTLVVYGTRPEYLKVKPILEKDKNIKSLFVKQHTDIIDFGDSDHSIDVESTTGDRLNDIFQQIFLKASNIISLYDNIIIQGDTATVAGIAIAAYNLKKKIFYVESGLRSFDLKNPYPEEGYRQMVSRIASVNFCPTTVSSVNLSKEGVLGKTYVVGNTVLDNILEHKEQCSYGKKVLVTLHRSENLSILHKWLEEIEKLAENNKDLEFILPVHPNPKIKELTNKVKYIKCVEPLEHKALIDILKKCLLVITDSGGIQEEGCFFNKKVIVCRKVTERPEGIATGHITLCKNPDDLSFIFDLLRNDFTIKTDCPYGDGKSSQRIVDILNEE